MLRILVFFLCSNSVVLGVILHPSGEPNLLEWTDRPDVNTVGRFGSIASFAVVAPDWIITTRHQNTFPSTVTIDGVSYNCHYKSEWQGGPAGTPPGVADIQLVRLTTLDGGNPNLVNYASPYEGSSEVGHDAVIGGFGDGRGAILQKWGITYGYKWDNSSNTTRRFGTNEIDGTEDDNQLGGYTSDVITAHFDDPCETIYESIPADHDSGGGWFIKVDGIWYLAGLARAVTIHYEEGHEGDPSYIESWFRNRNNPYQKLPDYFDAVRVGSYTDWIYEVILVDGDLTGDDWVDFEDYARFTAQWLRDDCGEQNDWCDGADLVEPYGQVDWDDLAFLADNWLTGWQY